MAERGYINIDGLPESVIPLPADAMVEVEIDGGNYKVPYSELGGTPATHAASHKDGGSDEIASSTPCAGVIPKADGNATLNDWIAPATESEAGKVVLAASGEASAVKALKANDPRLTDPRYPTAHGNSHVSGADPIPNATTTTPGLMSAEDKTALDAYDPSNLPSDGEKAALAGTHGTPSDTNRYVTDDDPRLEWNIERGISAAYSRSQAHENRLGFIPLFSEPSGVIDATPIVRIRGSDDGLLSFSSLTAGSVYYCASFPGTEVATDASDAILFGGDLYYATASGADIYRRPGITGTAALFLDDNYYTGFFVLNSTLYAIGRYGEDTNTAIFEIDTTLGTATYIATLTNVVNPSEIVPYLDRYLLIQQGESVYVVDMEGSTIEDVYIGTTDWYGQIIGAAVSGESMFQVEEIGKVRVRRSLHDSGNVYTFQNTAIEPSWFAIVGSRLYYVRSSALRVMYLATGAPCKCDMEAEYQIPVGLPVGSVVEAFSTRTTSYILFPLDELCLDGSDLTTGNNRFKITAANYVVRMVKLSATSWKLLDGTDAGTNIGEPKCRATLFFTGLTADDKEATYVIASNVCTITLASHEYQPDHWVYIDFTSGGGTDGWFKIASVINANTFTVPYPAGGGTSGSCTLKRLKILGGKGVHSVSGLVAASSPMVANLKRRAPNADDIICTNFAGNADSVYANQLKEAGFTKIYRTPVSVGFLGIAGSSTLEHFIRTCVGFFW